MQLLKQVLVGAVVISVLAVSPALASTSSESSQNKRISQALKTALSASKAAKSAFKTANSAAKAAKSASKAAAGAQATIKAILSQINAVGMISPELGVATVYAGNGPPTGTTPTSLSPIGTVFTSQIPRGGNNAAQASGTVLYNCTGPSINPSAGCNVQVRAAIRTTRAASDVSGSVGGGIVITQLNGGATTNAVDGSLTGNADGPGHDPVGAVGFTSQAPTNHDGTLLKFTPGIGSGIGIEGDFATIHLGSPGLYEIQGTVQFYDAK